jgi:hypothetical protein
MTSGFAQLSDNHRWQTMPGFQLSKTENCVGQSPAANRRILKAAVQDTINALALAERSTSLVLQDYL